MASKDIDVGGRVFHCPVEQAVEQAETTIRSRFGLQVGGIDQDGLPALGTAPISSLTGSLAFVDGCSAGNAFLEL